MFLKSIYHRRHLSGYVNFAFDVISFNDRVSADMINTIANWQTTLSFIVYPANVKDGIFTTRRNTDRYYFISKEALIAKVQAENIFEIGTITYKNNINNFISYFKQKVCYHLFTNGNSVIIPEVYPNISEWNVFYFNSIFDIANSDKTLTRISNDITIGKLRISIQEADCAFRVGGVFKIKKFDFYGSKIEFMLLSYFYFNYDATSRWVDINIYINSDFYKNDGLSELLYSIGYFSMLQTGSQDGLYNINAYRGYDTLMAAPIEVPPELLNVYFNCTKQPVFVFDRTVDGRFQVNTNIKFRIMEDCLNYIIFDNKENADVKIPDFITLNFVDTDLFYFLGERAVPFSLIKYNYSASSMSGTSHPALILSFNSVSLPINSKTYQLYLYNYIVNTYNYPDITLTIDKLSGGSTIGLVIYDSELTRKTVNCFYRIVCTMNADDKARWRAAYAAAPNVTLVLPS